MKKKLIIAFIIFTAIGVGLFYFLTMGNVGTDYNTVTVEKGNIGQQVADTGTISSKNIRQFYGNGVNKIADLPISLGDSVKKGQLIVTFKNSLDLDIQKVKKQIQALEATYKDALSGADMESVNNARIEISKTRSQYEVAKKDKERTEILYNSGAVSQKEFEDAVNDMEDLESSLKIAQNSYNKLVKGISDNKREQYEAEIDVLLLTLEILETSEDNYNIYSDVDGLVTALNTFEGDIPTPGKLMIELQDPMDKVVLVDFMVEDAISIKAGMDAAIVDLNLNINIDKLTVDQVYPKAFVTLSELSVEENRQTVEIGLSETGQALPFGLEVETVVMIESPKEALMVPMGTVYYKDGKSYVKIVENGDLVEREIETGIKSNKMVEVKEGVSEGEEVLLNYQED